MKNVWVFFAIVVQILFPVLANAQAATSERPERNLIVIGVTNEIADSLWRDARIGMGVRSLITQYLFETGQFNILEEKEEIKDKIASLSAGIWTLAEGNYDFSEGMKEARLLGANHVAYGKVVGFGVSRSNASFGVVHRNTVNVIVKIEVTIENLTSGNSITETGKGNAKTTANSLFFQFNQERAEFDKSGVGKATKDSIEEAVGKLSEKLGSL